MNDYLLWFFCFLIFLELLFDYHFKVGDNILTVFSFTSFSHTHNLTSKPYTTYFQTIYNLLLIYIHLTFKLYITIISLLYCSQPSQITITFAST